MYLVKYDLDTVQPLRDKNGRCIQVDKGEFLLLKKMRNFPYPEHIYWNTESEYTYAK